MLSAYHIIEKAGAAQYWVAPADNPNAGSTVSVVRAWPDRDLVLLQLADPRSPPFQTWHNVAKEEPQVADEVVAVLYMDDKTRTFIVGRMLSNKGADGFSKFDGMTASGSSGSCVLDRETGKLLGIQLGVKSWTPRVPNEILRIPLVPKCSTFAPLWDFNWRKE
jgi:hypothetical protein